MQKIRENMNYTTVVSSHYKIVNRKRPSTQSQVCSPSTQEAEVEGSQDVGQPRLHRLKTKQTNK
jgi:hypothetical protein